jgi:hypothetical protein
MNRQRYLYLIVAILVLVVSFSLAASPATARATKTEYSSKLATCEILDYGKYWESGNVLHVRGKRDKDRVITPVGEPDGWNISNQNVNFNPETLTGSAWGTFVEYYDGVDGTIEGSYSGVIRDGVFSGKVVGVGTGVYEGQLVKGELQEILVAQLPGGDPCPNGAVEPMGTLSFGIVLIPGNQ